MSAIDTDRFRTMLLEERARVQAAIERLHQDHPGSLEDETEEVAAGADNHLAETATATVDRAIDYTLGDNAENVLTEIEAALKRIDDGTYGTCARCGKPIGEERLEAIPWATLCIEDARKAEG
jgi:RNA polymerase-binding protein DksA